METFDSGSKFSWDHARTMRMGVTGAFLVTPASFSWNLYAERLAPGTSLRAILTKLGVSIAVLPPMVSDGGRGRGASVFAVVARTILCFWLTSTIHVCPLVGGGYSPHCGATEC